MADISPSAIADTRAYSTRWLLSFHGYNGTPLPDDGFQLKLPAPIRYYGREVKFGEQRYEIWSPNSFQDPYYPGRRTFEQDAELSSDPEQRRYDGQLGRFDPTLNPQYYDPQRPWLPFIERPYRPKCEDEVLFTHACNVWESEADMGHRGRIQKSFLDRISELCIETEDKVKELENHVGYRNPTLWRSRPRKPWAFEARQNLTGLLRYEDAVDRIRAVQRGLLEKRGWTNYVCAWSYFPRDLRDRDRVRAKPLAVVCDDWVGVWLHGIEEEEMLLYLVHAGVPCFLIHEYRDGEPRGEHVAHDFTEGINIAAFLDPYNYEPDRVALNMNRGKYVRTERLDISAGVPERSEEDCARSGGRWHLQLANSAPLPSNRKALSDNARDVDAVSLGPESDDDRMSVDVKPAAVGSALVVPAMTFPEMEEVVATRILKFLDLPWAFRVEDMKSWLSAGSRVSGRSKWLRIFTIDRNPARDYIVSFDSVSSALLVKGSMSGQGLVRLCVFVGETEFGEICKALKPVGELGLEEEVMPHQPYAGGCYVRKEPPATTMLPPQAPPKTGLEGGEKRSVPECAGTRSEPVPGKSPPSAQADSVYSRGGRPPAYDDHGRLQAPLLRSVWPPPVTHSSSWSSGELPPTLKGWLSVYS
ncbi:hypothetical protein B0H16DRAFT_1740012 [Mycena metata]|uniref:Uncharacterized protein n=1 Tax=Mycena metata TaxID=1033252 RepID=A0AAD7MI65_9AGAR|nr:hypothetical protein B0H16DRAFT_1740012 [Mycena metata]